MQWSHASGTGFSGVKLRVHPEEMSLQGRRRLFVDVTVIARRDAGTGIQRVVRAIWLQLLALDVGPIELIPVAATPGLGYRVVRKDFLDRPVGRLPLPIGTARPRPAKGDIFLGLDLAAHVVPRRRRDFLRWRRVGVSLAFVVYDTLPVQHPEWFSDKLRASFAAWLAFVCDNADILICISRAVAGDVRAYRGDTKARMAVMRLGAVLQASGPSRGLPVDADQILSWIGDATTVLMVGTLEPRKAYDQALSAFEQLWRGEGIQADARLLIVGRPGWHTEALQQRLREHPEQGQRLLWIDDASDEFLEDIYGSVDRLLLTSRGEGFGLPLIEAAAHRKPVMVRDLPVFREVAPKGVTFFKDNDADGLTTALANWLAAPRSIPDNPSTNSWDEAARDLLAALEL